MRAKNKSIPPWKKERKREEKRGESKNTETAKEV